MTEKFWLEDFETEVDRLRVHFVTQRGEVTSIVVIVTDKNLDYLADFLSRELKQPNLAEQLPDGTHLFHGSYNDMALTQTNLRRATRLLVGMALGFIEEAPLMMIFEYQAGQYAVIDLASEEQKQEIETFIEGVQKHRQQHAVIKISELVEA